MNILLTPINQIVITGPELKHASPRQKERGSYARTLLPSTPIKMIHSHQFLRHRLPLKRGMMSLDLLSPRWGSSETDKDTLPLSVFPIKTVFSVSPPHVTHPNTTYLKSEVRHNEQSRPVSLASVDTPTFADAPNRGTHVAGDQTQQKVPMTNKMVGTMEKAGESSHFLLLFLGPNSVYQRFRAALSS